MTGEAARLTRVRRQLGRAGFAVRKDRYRPSRNVNHQGGYMVVDLSSGTVVAGVRYELTLVDLEHLATHPGVALNN